MPCLSIRAAALLLAAALSGCATYRHGARVDEGPGLEFKAKEIEEFQANQNEVLGRLQAMAGLAGEPQGADWDRVIEAGMDFADSKCEAYMHALFRLNRDKKTVNAQISLFSTAAAGLMGMAESAAKEVAAVGVLFGLANSTVDNLASNMLYELEPSSVRTLVKTLQMGFRERLQPGYSSRPAALRVIRAYAMLCVPANIEAEVNLAVKKSVPAATDGNPSTGAPPEVSNAAVTPVSFKAQVDDSTTKLREFVFPGGQLNSANRARLEQFLRGRNLTVDVSSFMRLERFAADRAEAVRALGLP